MAPPRKKARVNGSEKTPYRRYSPNDSSEEGGSEAVLLNVDKNGSKWKRN
ncbi:Hypothetical protein FKW44_001112 [Caligus rogercresseyi]|uniref:Uncharacterized protein n=1 Tax=Caligus rogercresseyi TaxID=217165 RepID=A0A7T8KIB9_CALRO|nr:Hypothetical protein FKW44_001112 [Caligus rogercresseyi]